MKLDVLPVNWYNSDTLLLKMIQIPLLFNADEEYQMQMCIDNSSDKDGSV